VVVTTTSDYPHGVYHEAGWGFIGDKVPVLYAAVQFQPLRISLPLARYLNRYVKSFDIVHVHGLYRFPPTYAASIARRAQVPYIIRPHGALDPYLYAKSSRSVSLKRLYERWFDFPNLNAASAIHYTSEEERRRASFLEIRAPSFVIPNGLSWERYRNLPPRGWLRAHVGIGESPIVLFLGRLHFKKGLDLLIPAFDAVRRALPSARLVIVGPENDSYGENVRRWVVERHLHHAVHFVGHLEGPDVIRAYVDSDVFVLPSYTENFGMTVVEAMACRLAVVISDQVNIHEDVACASAGLVTRCDAGELAQALITLLSDVGRRRALGAAGRKLVRENYTWTTVVEKLTREYEAVLRQAKRRKGGRRCAA